MNFEIFKRLTGLCLLAATAMVSANTAQAIAVPPVLSSSYTITHTSGFGPVSGLGPKEIPSFPTMEYTQTLTSGPNTSTGWGGAGTFVFPTLVGLGFPAGTGIHQDWITGSHSAASLRIDFNVVYNVIGGFGPPTAAWANFYLNAFISDGGFGLFEYEATFTGAPGGILGGELSGSRFFEPGTHLNVPVRQTEKNENGVVGDGTITLDGFIQFTVFDGVNHDSSTLVLADPSAFATPPVPLPAALPILLGGLATLGLLRRRQRL